MFYRLPILFSVSYYFFIFFAQIVFLFFEQKVGERELFSFYILSKVAIYNLALFFFIFVLSCIFFYQNKLYFYTSQNKQKIVLLSALLAIVYLLAKLILLKLVLAVFFPNIINSEYLSYSYYDHDLHEFLYQIVSIGTYMWLLVIIGSVFYLVIRWSKPYFHAPLIDSMTQSHQNQFIDESSQLNSNNSISNYRKLYAMIFSAMFCCMISGIIWNFCFNVFFSSTEIKMFIKDYYPSIFSVAFLFISITYWFLYKISQKVIVRTYNWIPISILFTASVITLILFGVAIFVISCLFLPFIFAFKSLTILGIWFVICYILLYFLSRFVLKRSFA